MRKCRQASRKLKTFDLRSVAMVSYPKLEYTKVEVTYEAEIIPEAIFAVVC